MSGLFANTLTAGGKNSLLKRDNLTKSNQTQLSKKPKTCSELLCAFLNLD